MADLFNVWLKECFSADLEEPVWWMKFLHIAEEVALFFWPQKLGKRELSIHVFSE